MTSLWNGQCLAWNGQNSEWNVSLYSGFKLTLYDRSSNDTSFLLICNYNRVIAIYTILDKQLWIFKWWNVQFKSKFGRLNHILTNIHLCMSRFVSPNAWPAWRSGGFSPLNFRAKTDRKFKTKLSNGDVSLPFCQTGCYRQPNFLQARVFRLVK